MNTLFKTIRILTGLLFFLTTHLFAAGNTATQTATASMNIKTAIVLTNVANLTFPDAFQGDALLVLPATATTAASFNVTGFSGAQYLVDFPISSVTMITGTGATADQQIVVNAFTTNLAANTGTLPTGTGTFKVGATRAAIRATQVIANTYTATFSVRVTYL